MPELLDAGYAVRCLARSPGKLRDHPWAGRVEVVGGDVTDAESVGAAMEGVDVAYYLVHALGTGRGFEETDRRAMVGGLKFVRQLFAAPALAKYVVREKLPGPEVQSDEELLDYARQNGGTVYHASCSCMMGDHAMAVVDSELRVHGLDGLRVIDASVMPAMTSTNTDAPTIMIAEKGAAMIRAAARQKLAA